MRTLDTQTATRPRQSVPAAVLSNGSYAAVVTGWGTGGSFFEGKALTRWRGGPANDQDAFAIYLRDLDRGTVRTIGLRPAGVPAERYVAEALPGGFRIERTDGDLKTTLDAFVAPDAPLEVRRCTLRNRGEAPIRLELTSYLELALQGRKADLSHPAFSKLFVETGWDAAGGLLLARRRPRARSERHPWIAHTLLGAGDLEWETDRARFLGRGRDGLAPAAMEGPLSGTVGAVLDPILSVRCRLVAPPGEERTVCFLLAAGWDRDGAVRALRRVTDDESVEALRRSAASAADTPSNRLGGLEDELAAWGSNLAEGDAGRRLIMEVGAPRSRPAAPAEAPASSAESAGTTARLDSFNGYGGFTEGGAEYVLLLRRCRDGSLRLPPVPWINVLANESCGTLVSETGSQHTWRLNSREHPLTPWNNDPVRDRGGEAAYLQDQATGAYWSLWPSPTPLSSQYEVRHGFGSTSCRHRSAGLDHQIDLFVARRDPVKVARIRLTNPGPEPRRLALVTVQELVPGAPAKGREPRISVVWDTDLAALVARTGEEGPFAAGRTFAAVSVPGLRRAADFAANAGRHTYSADTRAFLGPAGDAAVPAALERNAELDDTVGEMPEACLAQRASFEIEPGGSAECLLLFGEAEEDALRGLIEHYRRLPAAAAAHDEVVAAWRDLLGGVQVRTPSAALDRALNGWLPYQTIACRLWARTAFYQSGGAFGFRDQIQDASALVLHAPEKARAQLLLHAAHQFVEGDVLHWWHPELETGLRTRFADDLVWLPYLTAHYVHATGDESVLAERAEFLRGRPLEPGEDEVLLAPEPSGEAADLYEHCARALDRSLAVGPHGLPLFGSGDWNDGMNRVGREGRGESVWMGFFLSAALRDFLPFCLRRGDTGRALAYAEHIRALRAALDDGGWDGEWYRRGYYDDGTPLGSRASDECRIDALVQAWAVLSRAASPERARIAMTSAEQHLVSRTDGIIRLLHPAFDKTPHDPGYIKGYVPGVRENGGQYTHAALWVVRALAELGRSEDAGALFEMLLPESHTRTEEEVARYKTEPYAIAADVYGAEPHVGRGGWTWYTGSAGWALRVGLESILGFRTVNGVFLEVRPCIPSAWPSYRIEYRVPRESTRYAVTVRRGSGPGNQVCQAWLDGDPVAVEDGRVRIPLLRDGKSHDVDVVLGT